MTHRSLQECVQNSECIRAAVLISGRGSNLKSLLVAQKNHAFARMKIVCVASNKPAAGGLEFARDYGIEVLAKSAADFATFAEFEHYLADELEQLGVQLIILAGYMRLIGSALLSRWSNAIVNIHPSLLPSFPGLHAQRQALEYGVRFSGCTIHFVDAGLDSGAIIAQRTVPVMPDDTELTLTERILHEEHALYRESLQLITEHPWQIQGRTVIFNP